MGRGSFPRPAGFAAQSRHAVSLNFKWRSSRGKHWHYGFAPGFLILGMYSVCRIGYVDLGGTSLATLIACLVERRHILRKLTFTKRMLQMFRVVQPKHYGRRLVRMRLQGSWSCANRFPDHRFIDKARFHLFIFLVRGV